MFPFVSICSFSSKVPNEPPKVSLDPTLSADPGTPDQASHVQGLLGRQDIADVKHVELLHGSELELFIDCSNCILSISHENSIKSDIWIFDQTVSSSL